MRALAVAAVLLTFTGSQAYAGNIATPKMEAVASWAAGRPISVYCSSDDEDWRRVTAAAGNPSGERAGGFTIYAEPVVYIAPRGCYGLTSTTPQLLGPALNVLLHEAAHQRGFRDEALTECAARVLIYSALHDFYGVPWFSERMRSITDAALAYSLTLPSRYQDGCSRF